MLGVFRISKARQACVAALQPILLRPQIADPWPPEFWQDPFVLGFFAGTIATVMDITTHPKKLTTVQSGHVLISTFKELGGYTPNLGERIERLAREKNTDYWQGVKNAEKVTLYMFGAHRSFDGVAFDQDPDVKEATEGARQTAVAMGTVVDGRAGREAIGGSLMYLLFHVPAESRLGM